MRNVRSFTYTSGGRVWAEVALYRIDFLPLYLPSFRRLESLKLSSLSIIPDIPGQIGLFSTFQQTLSSLNLACCHTTSSALITIVNYFPLLANLNLRSILYAVRGEPAPPLSRQIGRAHV